MPELEGLAERAKTLKRVVLVACGTAWHACLEGKFFIESLARIPCDVDYASEFRYRPQMIDGDTLVVAVSQSGETLDTLGALECAVGKGITLAVCNVVGASICRKADMVLYTHAGPEISVASTKAFSTQLVALELLALYLAQHRETLAAEDRRRLLHALMQLPHAVSSVLKVNADVVAAAKKLCYARDFLFLGRGNCYPIALEGALKLKEISYIHAEGYPAGEMKHGPIALIDEAVPVIVLAPSGPLFEKTVSNMQEVRARGGKIVLVSDRAGLDEAGEGCLATIEMPRVHPLIAPLVYAVPVQLLAYHVACVKGTDVDQPRNLAKSVTVE